MLLHLRLYYILRLGPLKPYSLLKLWQILIQEKEFTNFIRCMNIEIALIKVAF